MGVKVVTVFRFANMDPIIRFQMPVRRFFRRRRFKKFLPDYAAYGTILDVGGDHSIWNIVERTDGITLLNLFIPEDDGGFLYVVGSGMALPYQDLSFDLVFSNSVIEHVGSVEDQFKFASEMLRVGKKVY